jgi:hypothetical protein
MAAPKRAPAASSGFSFGDMSAYSSGGVLPEGDYCWKDVSVQMFQGTKADGSPAGAARLGVMITLVALGNGGEEHTQFYSLGSKAHESWASNAETGKGIVAVPGGPGTPPNASTNWVVLVKSLFDSGLPQGILNDDLSVLDGLWVHMANIPEPAERAGFKSKTGEAAVEDRPRTISVVTALLDGGLPWEGGGGVPAPKGKAAVSPAATKQATRAAAGAPTAAANLNAGGDIEEAATGAASEVLGKIVEGSSMPKLMLRTSMFKVLNTGVGPEMAKQVLDTYFKSDATINSLINPQGFTLDSKSGLVKAA